MRALIDGDLILYRAANAVQTRMYIGYTKEGVPFTCSPRKKELAEGYDSVQYVTMVDEDGYEEACGIIDDMITAINKEVEATSTAIFLTGRGNFRKDIYPEYKAHRPDKPLLFEALQIYMCLLDNVYVVEGQEADDELGITQCNSEDTIICSYDKDLLMIPGRHYRFDRKEFVTVTEEEGSRAFYTQLLTGDRTDNIPGLMGVGPKGAAKILEGCVNDREMYDNVVDEYIARMPDRDKGAQLVEENLYALEDEVIRNARLLWIRRNEGELWQPPV